MSEVSPIEQARFNMVQQQIRPWHVFDDRVLDVMTELPRESFVPDAYRGLAYADIEVPLMPGRTMPAPRIVARMLQALQVQPGDRALEIGTGNGYVTACLAQLGAQVLSLESDVDLAQAARGRLAALSLGASEVRVGDGLAGGPVEGGPFDVIAVTGSLPEQAPLDALQAQLAPNGRLFVIVGQPPVMEAIRVTRVGAQDFRREALFETCSAALVERPNPAAFVF